MSVQLTRMGDHLGPPSLLLILFGGHMKKELPSKRWSLKKLRAFCLALSRPGRGRRFRAVDAWRLGMALRIIESKMLERDPWREWRNRRKTCKRSQED